MRRRLVFGALTGVLALCGCAAPSGGRARYQPPRPAVTASPSHSRASTPATVAPTPVHGPAAKASPGRQATGRPPTAPATPVAPPASTPASAPTSHGRGKSGLSSQASMPEFAVCLSFYQVAAGPNVAFRRLPRHASQHDRDEVARAYAKAHDKMVQALRHSGLPRWDVVYVRGDAVTRAISSIVTALTSGRGVSNEKLRAAFVSLNKACAR